MRRSSGIPAFSATNLTTNRRRAGVSSEQLAVLAGLSPETVRRCESGARQPSARTVRALAEALGVPVDELVPEPSSVARTLRHLRLAAGATQRQLADRIGVSTQMVSRVERGIHRAGEPAKWAAAYGVPKRTWQAAWQASHDERAEQAARARRKGDE